MPCRRLILTALLVTTAAACIARRPSSPEPGNTSPSGTATGTEPKASGGISSGGYPAPQQNPGSILATCQSLAGASTSATLPYTVSVLYVGTDPQSSPINATVGGPNGLSDTTVVTRKVGTGSAGLPTVEYDGGDFLLVIQINDAAAGSGTGRLTVTKSSLSLTVALTCPQVRVQ
jgi:hypothetical protein